MLVYYESNICIRGGNTPHFQVWHPTPQECALSAWWVGRADHTEKDSFCFHQWAFYDFGSPRWFVLQWNFGDAIGQSWLCWNKLDGVCVCTCFYIETETEWLQRWEFSAWRCTPLSKIAEESLRFTAYCFIRLPLNYSWCHKLSHSNSDKRLC